MKINSEERLGAEEKSYSVDTPNPEPPKGGRSWSSDYRSTHRNEDNFKKITDWSGYLNSEKVAFEERQSKNFRNPDNIVLSDFERHSVLGAGSFGTVIAVTCKKTNKHYAMKILDKRKIVEQHQVRHTFAEKKTLQAVNLTFLVSLRFYYYDTTYLYFVMPLALGGEMFNNLRAARKFNEELARFYSAQVVLGIEYLHYVDVIYRDLKPENIVLFDNGYLKITDFGFAKIVKGRTYTMCGTPEYLAPEVILSKGYGKSVDWWAVGVLIYEMLVGFSPFQADNTKQIYEKIVAAKIRFPKSMSKEAQNLIRRFVEPDLTRRLGNLKQGVMEIKTHEWFEGIDWLAILNMEVKPPVMPVIKNVGHPKFGDPYRPEDFLPGDKDIFPDVFKDFV